MVIALVNISPCYEPVQTRTADYDSTTLLGAVMVTLQTERHYRYGGTLSLCEGQGSCGMFEHGQSEDWHDASDEAWSKDSYHFRFRHLSILKH